MQRQGFLKAGRIATRQIALTALASATIEAVKFALNAVPNVEGVTLLCAVYGYCLGAGGVVAALVFCGIETAIFGVGPWVISYFIHWPAVALVFMLLARLKVKNRWILTLIAAVMTTLFGVQTSLVDTGLLTGFFDRFWYRFSIIYVRGAVFYIVQIICNLVVFPLLFVPLTKVLIPAARKAKMCPLPVGKNLKKPADGAPYDGFDGSNGDNAVVGDKDGKNGGNTDGSVVDGDGVDGDIRRETREIAKK